MIDLKQIESGETLVKSEDLLESLATARQMGYEPDYIEIEDAGCSIRIFWKSK